MKSDIVDITVVKIAETEKAVRVTDAEDKDGAWLPKSQIEIEDAGRGTCVVTAPEWLLVRAGLL